jgi:hypothetical protein
MAGNKTFLNTVFPPKSMIVLDTLANIGLLFFLFLSFGKVGLMEGDDEVDAKDNDFINRFKQQLKLQRLDSIIRFKDASNRGWEVK